MADAPPYMTDCLQVILTWKAGMVSNAPRLQIHAEDQVLQELQPRLKGYFPKFKLELNTELHFLELHLKSPLLPYDENQIMKTIFQLKFNLISSHSVNNRIDKTTTTWIFTK